MSHITVPPAPNEAGPAWDVARLFPDQGGWSEGDYLDLVGRTNQLVELSDGRIKVLGCSTTSHQRILGYVCRQLAAFVEPRRLGRVVVAAYPVRLRPGTFREPDVVFMLAEHADRLGEEYAEGADLVMEVVSEKNRAHDLVIKRAEYAAAGIPEYWIVDPRDRKITVLSLSGDRYTIHGEFDPGSRAASVLLTAFEVDVDALFTAGVGK
ncbi:MAG: hypothetical protein AMXMBFR13_47960 [Phycisphaerae bacterium]